MPPTLLQATQSLATIPKCYQALCFQEDSHVLQLNRVCFIVIHNLMTMEGFLISNT